MRVNNAKKISRRKALLAEHKSTPRRPKLYQGNEEEWLRLFKKVQRGSITQTNAAEQLGVPRQTFQSHYKRWADDGAKDSIEAVGDRRLRAFATFQRSLLSNEEEERLMVAIKKKRSAGHVISRRYVRILAATIFPNLDGARFTYRWVKRFCERHKLVFRKAKQATKTWTLAEWNRAAEDFWREIENFRDYLELEESQIANFDETRIVFGDTGEVTLETQGKKGVYISPAGSNQKKGITVLTGVKANGEKLPCLFILKGRKRGPRNVTVPDAHFKDISQSGWINGEVFGRWAARMLHSGEHLDLTKPSLVILDRYKTHMEQGFLTRNEQHNIRTAFIPGGMTSALQPLDNSKLLG